MSDTILTQNTDSGAQQPVSAPVSATPGDTPANALGLWNKVAATAVAEKEAREAGRPFGAQPQPTQPQAERRPAAATPDAYADFALPEGVQPDTQLSAEFKALAKELGLPQEGAQRLVDLYAERAREAAEGPTRLWQEQQSQWQKQVKADRELGGLGLARNIATAGKAIDAFGGPDLRRALEITGAGNHPDVVRFFYRVGKAISEDGMVAPRAARSTKSYAEIFYPDHNN